MKYLIVGSVLIMAACESHGSKGAKGAVVAEMEPAPKPPAPITEEDILRCDRYATTSDYFTQAEQKRRNELRAKEDAAKKIDRVVGNLQEGESGYASAHLDSFEGKLFTSQFSKIASVKSNDMDMKVTRVHGGVLVDCASSIVLYRKDNIGDYDIPVIGKQR